MIRNIFLTTAIFCALFFYNADGNANSQGPVVVELFTSQGCSSCPPADQIMNQLSQNPNFISLSYHVTYWDHLNWKDTLGREFADQRQRNYSKFKRMNRVYTPQMIINGGKEFVGSRKHEANKHLRQANPVAQISMSGLTPQGTMLALPNVTNGDYSIWIAGVKTNHTEQIGRGENRNKTVTYNNTVLTFDRGGRWDGQAKTINLNIDKTNPEIDHYVVFAQNKAYGEIVAAGKINI